MKNILILTCDELRADSTGFAGNPDVRTPHMDRIAARGTVFERHFTPFPKCVPARCAMQTGRYTHTEGWRTVMPDNHLAPGDPNLCEFLRTQGYETAFLGLNHVWPKECFYGSGEKANRRSGGVVDYTSYTDELRPMTTLPREYPPGSPRTGPHFAALAEVDYVGLKTGRSESSCDQNTAEQAVHFLEKLRQPDKPFFLQVNLSKPHPPYEAPEPYYSMYDPDRLVPFPHDLPRNAPLPLVAQRRWRLGDDVPPAALREIQAVYYAMVSWVDAQVGRVFDALERAGLAEDTLVILTSDHGDYAGQYGINEKWDASLQDCLLHVPFVMAGPGVKPGMRVSGLSEHVDQPATILEFLGLRPPAEWVWHGRSLWPMLNGGPGAEAVFADGGHEAVMRARFAAEVYIERNGRRVKATGGKQLTYQQCPDAMARCKMVRTLDWKLVIRETGGNELYHVASDPHEMNNVYGDPAHAAVVADLQLKLIQWCLRTDTDRPHLREFGA